MDEEKNNLNIKQVFYKEAEAICCRRKKLGINSNCEEEIKKSIYTAKAVEPDIDAKIPFDTFGIALSGGGIRSATFNLGFLKALNDKGIFKYTDYLSTVSGGGYIGGFIQNRLMECQNYDSLFEEPIINHLKKNGDYLRPGKGLKKLFESINFYINTIILFLLHSFWYILFFIFLLTTLFYLKTYLPNIPSSINIVLLSLLFLTVIWYYFFHGLRHISTKFWSDKTLFYTFSILTIIIFLISYAQFTVRFDYLKNHFFDLGIFLFFLGLFSNPNILSSYRFYRMRLKDTFLQNNNPKLYQLLKKEKKDSFIYSPYPLINTTLNLQSDESISGMKSCDYFLLSPLFCGSKITGYTHTNKSEYKNITLATAITISGAALNPNMGYKSNRIISFFMTLMNIRLGYWALNPKIFYKNSKSWIKKFAVYLAEKFGYVLTFWPYYNIAELLGIMNSHRIRINLSDGGHIENLGVFELLRRKCKLIIASDASADPNYTFSDLKNLQIRARNELELCIEFSKEQNPEKNIKPNLLTGQSIKNYAIGKIYELPKNIEDTKKFIGYFIYVKASITPQHIKLSAEDRKNDFYSYKNYHPDFPHESTVDQFFDEKQWEAYKTLGYKIGEDLFKDFYINEEDKNNDIIPHLMNFFKNQLDS